MGKPLTLTTPLGAPLPAVLPASDRRAAIGLPQSDRRDDFTLAAGRIVPQRRQAAWLATTLHEPLRAAARTYLEPIASTWLQDWLRTEPEFRELASFVRRDYPDVPAYLA